MSGHFAVVRRAYRAGFGRSLLGAGARAGRAGRAPGGRAGVGLGHGPLGRSSQLAASIIATASPRHLPPGPLRFQAIHHHSAPCQRRQPLHWGSSSIDCQPLRVGGTGHHRASARHRHRAGLPASSSSPHHHRLGRLTGPHRTGSPAANQLIPGVGVPGTVASGVRRPAASDRASGRASPGRDSPGLAWICLGRSPALRLPGTGGAFSHSLSRRRRRIILPLPPGSPLRRFPPPFTSGVIMRAYGGNMG